MIRNNSNIIRGGAGGGNGQGQGQRSSSPSSSTTGNTTTTTTTTKTKYSQRGVFKYYSRVVYLLSFILISCGIFLILSHILFTADVPSSSSSSSTTTSSSQQNNGFETPPILTGENENENKNKVVKTVNADTNTASSTDTSSNAKYFYTSQLSSDENNNNSDRMLKSMTWDEIDKGSIYTRKRTNANHGKGPKQIPTQLPLPIFVMNMPKSGSTTIHQFFSCGIGKLFSVHHTFNKKDMDPIKRDFVPPDMALVAACMGHNLISDKPLIKGCGGFSVWTDSGAVVWDVKGDDALVLDHIPHRKAPTKEENSKLPHRNWCFYPGVHALENIEKYYPYATILHLPRNSTDWVQSSTGWSKGMMNIGLNNSIYETEVQNRHIVNAAAADGNGMEIVTDNTNNNQNANANETQKLKPHGKTMLDRYELKCNGFENDGKFIGPPKFGQNGQTLGSLTKTKTKARQKTNKEWINWYDNDYTAKIRNFALNHPTLTYFESPLDDPLTPVRLEKVTGINSEKCFGHHLKTSDRLERWKQKNQKNTDGDKDGKSNKDKGRDNKKSTKKSNR